LEHVVGIKFKWREYLQKTIKFISLNIEYLVFVVYSIENRLKRIYKSLYSVFIYVLFLFTFYTMSQLHWNWGCR